MHGMHNDATLKQRAGFRQSIAMQMAVGKVGDFSASRSSLNEAFLDEIRLIDLLQSTRVLTEGSSDGC